MLFQFKTKLEFWMVFWDKKRIMVRLHSSIYDRLELQWMYIHMYVGSTKYIIVIVDYLPNCEEGLKITTCIHRNVNWILIARIIYNTYVASDYPEYYCRPEFIDALEYLRGNFVGSLPAIVSNGRQVDIDTCGKILHFVPLLTRFYKVNCRLKSHGNYIIICRVSYTLQL